MACMDLLTRLDYARFVRVDSDNLRVLVYYNEVEEDNGIHIFDLAGNKLMEISLGDSVKIPQEQIEGIMNEIVEKGWYVGINTVGFVPVAQ